MMKYIAFISVFVLYACVTDTDTLDDSELSEEEFMDLLWEQELANQNRAIFGPGDFDVEIIEDLDEVIAIENRLEKQKLISEKSKEDVKLSLGEHYRSGDKSILPNLIKVLKGSYTDEKRDIFFDLGYTWDAPLGFSIEEIGLQKAILENVNRGGADEKSAIQLAGIMKVNGYEKVFEDRLAKGKSSDEGRLIYWLGESGLSSPGLDLVIEKAFKAGDDLDLINYCLGAMETTAENGNLHVQNKVFEAAWEIHESEVIPLENFEELKRSWSSANPAIPLLSIIFTYGDKRAIPLAEEYFDEDIERSSALICLVRLEGDKHKEKLTKLFFKEETYNDGFFALLAYAKMHPFEDLAVIAVEQFAEHNGISPDNYVIENFFFKLEQLYPGYYWDFAKQHISNQSLIREMKEVYELRQIKFEDVSEYLLKEDLIDESLTIGKIDGYESENGWSAVQNALDASEISYWFDTETGMVPVDYDVLIQEFFALSKGQLASAKVYMDTGPDDVWESIPYEVSVIYNEVAFVINPEDIGDWYDLGHVLTLLNTILDHNNVPERYVMLPTGDQTAQVMFGLPEKIAAFISEFKLDQN